MEGGVNGCIDRSLRMEPKHIDDKQIQTHRQSERERRRGRGERNYTRTLMNIVKDDKDDTH